MRFLYKKGRYRAAPLMVRVFSSMDRCRRIGAESLERIFLDGVFGALFQIFPHLLEYLLLLFREECRFDLVLDLGHRQDAGGAFAGEFDDVEAELGLDDTRRLPFLEGEGSLLEFGDHGAFAEPAEVTPLGTGGVGRVFPGQVLELAARFQLGKHVLCVFLGLQENMAGAHLVSGLELFLVLVIELLDIGIGDLCLFFDLLLPVSFDDDPFLQVFQPVDDRRALVDAGLLCLLQDQFPHDHGVEHLLAPFGGLGHRFQIGGKDFHLLLEVFGGDVGTVHFGQDLPFLLRLPGGFRAA
jgi:hypothetical protein